MGISFGFFCIVRSENGDDKDVVVSALKVYLNCVDPFVDAALGSLSLKDLLPLEEICD